MNALWEVVYFLVNRSDSQFLLLTNCIFPERTTLWYISSWKLRGNQVLLRSRNKSLRRQTDCWEVEEVDKLTESNRSCCFSTSRSVSWGGSWILCWVDVFRSKMTRRENLLLNAAKYVLSEISESYVSKQWELFTFLQTDPQTDLENDLQHDFHLHRCVKTMAHGATNLCEPESYLTGTWTTELTVFSALFMYWYCYWHWYWNF